MLTTGRKKNLKASILITRPSRDDVVLISIEDKASRLQVAQIEMSVLDFGRMISRPQNVDCEVELNVNLNIGKRLETKTVFVDLHPRDEFPSAYQRAAAPHEVDGWSAEVERGYNPHRKTDQGYAIHLRRWVEE